MNEWSISARSCLVILFQRTWKHTYPIEPPARDCLQRALDDKIAVDDRNHDECPVETFVVDCHVRDLEISGVHIDEAREGVICVCAPAGLQFSTVTEKGIITGRNNLPNHLSQLRIKTLTRGKVNVVPHRSDLIFMSSSSLPQEQDHCTYTATARMSSSSLQHGREAAAYSLRALSCAA